MLLGTGLGSNSLTGSPKQAPMGTRSTLTVAVTVLLEHVRTRLDPTHEKFLTVIGLADRTVAGYSLVKDWLRRGGCAIEKMDPFL
jgi:hypothetical protein